MDYGQFDELARTAVAETSARRMLLRLVAGSVMGSVVTGLLWDEQARAKAKSSGKNRESRHKRGQVHAAGKKRGRKDKRKKRGKDKPEPVAPCAAGFRRCGSGSCVADRLNVCCSDERICRNGRCVKDACCSDEKACGSECMPKSECCELEVPLCTACEDVVCESGTWVCRSECTGGKTCCLGVCIPPCTNGCTIDDGCGHCTEAPEGKVYCEGKDQCVTKCEPGKRLHPDTCTCTPTGPTCRPGYDDCRSGNVCCDGHCIPCPQAGICSNGVCNGCGSPNSVFCPPNPQYIYGFCCPPQNPAGHPFNYCHIPGEPNSGSWGCYYKSSI